ncbi:hypothetical protein MKW94_001559, partial [Papaver nudicaule]|nr:hypothetical protein [Papaver nudicaule]
MGGEIDMVAEHVLKKNKRAEEWDLAEKTSQEVQKIKNTENRKLIYKRAEQLQYAQEYSEKERELTRLKRGARLKGGFYVNPNAKFKMLSLYTTCRIVHYLQWFVLKVNKATLQMLQRELSHMYPDLITVKELIYKRLWEADQ